MFNMFNVFKNYFKRERSKYKTKIQSIYITKQILLLRNVYINSGSLYHFQYYKENFFY